MNELNYLDKDGLFYLIFLMALTIKELEDKIDDLERRAILDSS